MDLSIYQIIKGPVVTDKAYRLNNSFKKLVLEVHPAANKPMVREALEKLFDVKIENIRMIVRKGKTKRVKRHVVKGSSSKRAIVTLKEGYSLDSISQAGTQAVVSGSDVSENKTRAVKKTRGQETKANKGK